MRKSLNEIAVAAKSMNFTLPPGITFTKELMADGRYGYVFRHANLGQLGRILVLPHNTNQTQLTCEVSGDLDDPMTLKRQEILEPISKDILAKMGLICGDGVGQPEQYESPRDLHRVQGMVYPCEVCEKTVAQIIFADGAKDDGQLENYARIMHSKIKELDVPTWIIGEETENIVNGEDLRKSLVLKVYPDRQSTKIMTPDDIMDEVDKLVHQHCRN